MASYFWNTLASHGGFEFLTLLAWAAAKATLLLAFAALLCFAFRRFSAAARHLLWASALCAALLLPFLSFIKMWELPILPARMSALVTPAAKESTGNDEALRLTEARAARDSSRSRAASVDAQKVSDFQTNAVLLEESLPASNTPAAQSPSQNEATSVWPRFVNLALAVWVGGMLLVLLKVLAGFAATKLLTRRAVEVEDAALAGLFSSLLVEINLKSRVRLLQSERTSMPMVCGVLRPAVLLPAEANAWSEERRRMVLLHELTHVKRRDCLTQMLAQVACAVYWFNPSVWYAARRLRIEREQACDDYVLSIGTKPSDYANHLLEIARSMRGRSVFEWSQTTGVAMARRSQLEGRLVSILSKENKRGVVSRAVLTGFLALTCVLLVSLAAVRPTVIHAQNPRHSQAAPNAEKDDVERASPGSPASVGSRRDGSTEIQGAEARQTDAKQEDTAATVVGQREQDSDDGRIENEAGRNIEGERLVEKVVAEVAERQVTTVVQMPEVEPLVNVEANTFINAGYKQDRNAQAQERSGDFIDEMASVGYTNLSIDELIRLKTSGVTAEFVRSLRAAGLAN
ncbi:MAG TPA: M56 family metallopeptidase, partial [Pyrinomonadaceae bacterium]|nr:M56 family metallopeptidase [Pyrinomonadaceae bacterium]